MSNNLVDLNEVYFREVTFISANINFISRASKFPSIFLLSHLLLRFGNCYQRVRHVPRSNFLK